MTVERVKRDTVATGLPEGWFYPNPDNDSFICVPLVNDTSPYLPMTATTPTTTPMTTPMTTPSTPSTPSPRMDSVCRGEAFPLDGSVQLLGRPTFCLPDEDAFNPCEDLLGEDDVLRSFIWIVIILALFGNSFVIIVFLGYSVILKHTKIDLFIVYFFYCNLAVADLLMGVYLFTIAVVDLRTLGNFSMYDIQWRTGGGCGFAGFCAVSSTMVSVYVLVVITVERLYTFTRALRKSHINKITGVIVMAIGWGFGILMGILPLVGVSDYSSVAICLPFSVSSKLALSYVLFLLLFTGIAFTVIAVSYVLIFYQVFCRQRATLTSVSDKKRWKTELKVALRMGILVFTNFVCWFPIALLGIAAAVGNSFVDVSFAKWVMVFVFPINACLNPILYSVLSKVFRDNVVLILGKCGLCKRQIAKIKKHRAGFTPSVISSRSQVGSESGVVSESRRGTIMERFRNFSITSTTNLLGRRSSAMSQGSSEEHYQLGLMTRAQRRRSSEYSSASSEDILANRANNSRRGSTFSGGSTEEGTTFSNPGFRSSSPISGSNATDNSKGSPRPRISLGAVPEEENENCISEVTVAPEVSGEGKHNPAYVEVEGVKTEVGDSENRTDGKIRHNGIIGNPNLIVSDVHHHRIIDSEVENDSGHSKQNSVVPNVASDSEDMKRSVVADSLPAASDHDVRPHEVVSIEFD